MQGNQFRNASFRTGLIANMWKRILSLPQRNCGCLRLLFIFSAEAAKKTLVTRKKRVHFRICLDSSLKACYNGQYYRLQSAIFLFFQQKLCFQAETKLCFTSHCLEKDLKYITIILNWAVKTRYREASKQIHRKRRGQSRLTSADGCGNA